MSNYDADTLNMIPGNTPKEKYDFIHNLFHGKKTDLEVFVKMNENDITNGTETLGLCYDWRNANKCKGGAVIEMAMPEAELYNIMNHKRIPVLVLVDRAAYVSIKKA